MQVLDRSNSLPEPFGDKNKTIIQGIGKLELDSVLGNIPKVGNSSFKIESEISVINSPLIDPLLDVGKI